MNTPLDITQRRNWSGTSCAPECRNHGGATNCPTGSTSHKVVIRNDFRSRTGGVGGGLEWPAGAGTQGFVSNLPLLARRHAVCLSEDTDTLQHLEDRMARWTRLFSAFAVMLVLGACGQGSTDTPLSPAVPRMDGGGGTSLGGNTVDPNGGGSGSTTTTSNTTTTAPAQDSVGVTTGGTSLGGN